MTNRFLRKYIKKKSSKLIFAMVAIIFVLQTSPIYCGACLIGECTHDASTYASFGNVPCHDTMGTYECCYNNHGKEFKSSESGTQNCTTCDCFLKGAIGNTTNITLATSGPVRILFVSGFCDIIHTSFNCTKYPHFYISQPQVQYSPIFILNSTFLF